MTFQQPFSQVVHKRYSCRSYHPELVSESAFQDLESYIANLPAGPFNGPSRFKLASASGDDRSSLRGLGTYGTIKIRRDSLSASPGKPQRIWKTSVSVWK